MKKAYFSCAPAACLKEMDKGRFRESAYVIDETISLSQEEYDRFGENLPTPNPMLAGKGGRTPEGVIKCVAMEARERNTLLINPEGGDCASMVAYL